MRVVHCPVERVEDPTHAGTSCARTLLLYQDCVIWPALGEVVEDQPFGLAVYRDLQVSGGGARRGTEVTPTPAREQCAGLARQGRGKVAQVLTTDVRNGQVLSSAGLVCRAGHPRVRVSAGRRRRTAARSPTPEPVRVGPHPGRADPTTGVLHHASRGVTQNTARARSRACSHARVPLPPTGGRRRALDTSTRVAPTPSRSGTGPSVLSSAAG